MTHEYDSIPSTNFDRWQYYMKDVTSPKMFIDLGFYYMIAAALQRRVYVGSDERPLFPNMYIILVAEPGIGKGLVIKPVAEFLKHHKLRRFKLAKDKPLTSDDMKANMEMMESMLAEFNQVNPSNQVDPKLIQSANGQTPKGSTSRIPDEPLLIPVAADATTYEALVRNHANALRSIITKSPSRLAVNGIYSHSSLCFALEEISSLFRKHTEDVVNYLLKAYDCGDYVYETRTQGISRVKSMCLSFFGGASPSFMKSTFTDELLNEGFASRTVFSYAPSNRFERFEMAKMNEAQLTSKIALLEHIEKLSALFGQVTYSPAAHVFMKNYVENELPERRKKCPHKLLHYYARKNITIQKMAMAMHFAESTEMVIQLDTCIKAIEFLSDIETTMELALESGGRNPLGTVQGKVFKAIQQSGPLTFIQLWTTFIDNLNKPELEEILSFLTASGKIRQIESPNSANKYIAT